MRSKTADNLHEKKKKKKQKAGNSQFTRAKLQQEYKPTIRPIKQNLFSLHQLDDHQKHSQKVQEQISICDKAVHHIKQGKSIKIDWNTRTNFRTTQSVLPHLKTQPLYQRCNNSHVITTKSIQEKQDRLRKMLFKRQKKAYLASKQQQQEQIQLFGQKSTRQNTMVESTILAKKIQQVNKRQKMEEVNKSQMKKYIKSTSKRQRKSIESTPKRQRTMVQVQQKILTDTKLKVLRDELKLKFIELREQFIPKRGYRRRFITSPSQQEFTY